MSDIDLWSEIEQKRRELNVCIREMRKTCYGIPEVADMRFKRDVAETVWKANQEAVNSIKLQLRILDNQLQREWSTPQAGM